MLFTSLTVQVVMIVTLAKLKVIYAQEQKNMLVVINKVPFMTILTTAVVTAILTPLMIGIFY